MCMFVPAGAHSEFLGFDVEVPWSCVKQPTLFGFYGTGALFHAVQTFPIGILFRRLAVGCHTPSGLSHLRSAGQHQHGRPEKTGGAEKDYS